MITTVKQEFVISRVTIEMSALEAGVLKTILGNVLGSDTQSARVITSALFDQLSDAKIKAREIRLRKQAGLLLYCEDDEELIREWNAERELLTSLGRNA